MRPVPFLARSAAVLGLAGALALPVAAGPGVPPLLDTVLRKMAADQERWACTWTSVYTFIRDHPEGTTQFLADPSLPYAEQWKPRLISGKPPTEKALQDFRKNGEKQGRERELKQPPADGLPYQVHMVLDYNLVNQQAVAYYDEAVLVREEGGTAIFDVPLHSNNPVPVDIWGHFHLVLRVNRQLANIEHASIPLRTPIWFIKVRAYHIDTDFRTVDPAFGGVPAAMDAVIDVSIFLKKYYFRQQVTWTDYRRVIPYGDRFNVRIGPLRTLGF
jgi:hypothetical protein